jgi:hypothetical protein
MYKKILSPHIIHGTKGIRVATQIAEVKLQPLNRRIKGTNLRLIADSSKSGKIELFTGSHQTPAL